MCSLFGAIILSRQFEIELISKFVIQYCKFLEHNIGLAIFYL